MDQPGTDSGAPVLREVGQWRVWHTGALLALTAVCVYMAIWRPLDLYASWVTVMGVLAAFVLVAGHGIKGVWRGAFIDERNKMSLSRLQMLAWTILVLAGLGALGIARALEDPATGLDIAVPATVWLLMGISTTSLIGSPLLKNAKKAAPEPRDSGERLRAQGTDPARIRMDGQVVSNRSVRDARWSDLFLGEEVETATYLDIAKVQMFFFTVLLVLAYGVAIAAGIRAETLPDALPDIGEGMLALLGLSHAGYLVSKAAPASKPGSKPAASAPEGG